jgi:hypothetical protein
MEQITSHPLCWPAGWKRTPAVSRKRANFRSANRDPATSSYRYISQLTVAGALKRVLGELGRMGVGDWNVIVSTNIQTRRDGLPYSNQSEPKDQGAAVYWKDKKGNQKCMAIDRYDRVADNLAAIAATIEAMRAIERHGGAEILDRAFTGFTALPEPEQWWQVLGFAAAPQALEWAEARYRELAKKHHPDMAGGDAGRFARLANAIDHARSWFA